MKFQRCNKTAESAKLLLFVCMYVLYCVECSVFSVKSFFCFVSQNNEETAECGASRGAEGALNLRHCMHLNVNSYI